MMNAYLDMLLCACYLSVYHVFTPHAWSACQHPLQFDVVVVHSSLPAINIALRHLYLLVGTSDIALQHTAVEPGGFMLEDTFLLVAATNNLDGGASVRANFVVVPCANFCNRQHDALCHMLTSDPSKFACCMCISW